MHRFAAIVFCLITLIGIGSSPAAASDRATCLAVNSGASDAKALDACTAAIESGKFRATELARLYNSRGLALTNLGQYDRALPDLTQALQIAGKNPVLLNNRGLAYKAKGEFDLAIADYSEALRLDSKYEDGFHNRGRAHLDRRDYAEAIADYSSAIRLNPKNRTHYGGG